MRLPQLPSRSSNWNRHYHVPWYQRISRTHVGFAVAGVFAILLVIFAFQAAQANSALRLASNQAEVLQNQIVAGDDEGAKATLSGLQESTKQARDKTSGPLWDIGSHVPYFGKNVSAVQTVAEVVDDIAMRAMPPVVGLSKQVNLNTFSPHKGRINIAAIKKIRPSVIEAATALTRANDKLKGIDADSLLVPIRGPVATIQYKIGSAQSAAVSGRTAARLMPSMLGANDTRRYLLLNQSNAEIRPTGGIAGSFAILKADKGKLSMGQQGSIQDLRPFAKPVVPMTKEESSVFSSALVTDLRDANFTPNFPRTGQITRVMAKKGLGVDVDGVISVDPIALSYLLAATGPVTLSDGTVLDQSNAVDVLLNGIYQRYQNNDQQDDVFASAARKIFDVVKGGQGQSRGVIEALVAAANENRLTVWSSHTPEQREIAQTGLSGIVGGDDGKTPHVGVYLSDASASKMEYYLDYTTVVRTGRCLSGGIQELSTVTELVSNAPRNVKDLPASVTGLGTYAPRGTLNLVLRAYSPYGGGFTNVRVNGENQTVYADRHLGRNVTSVHLLIKPGETYTVTTTMISGRGQTADAIFSTTPGVQNTLNDVSVKSACS
jgi:hypothetical protein